MRKLKAALKSVIHFLSEAAGRFFTPAEEIPEIGVQPYSEVPPNSAQS
ncbi:hypothetical protein [Synechococcus elongatus]|uniref:Isochorismate synthase n=2 Tax=Synechococcus elongatus TaxID=32046 RepID=A0AAQ3MBI9_SYNEL|nr:hypothetical protein [Synechococcus elongatus]